MKAGFDLRDKYGNTIETIFEMSDKSLLIGNIKNFIALVISDNYIAKTSLPSELEIENAIKDLDWGIKNPKTGDGYDWVAVMGKLEDKLPKAIAHLLHTLITKQEEYRSFRDEGIGE